jgi:hypothetical protein
LSTEGRGKSIGALPLSSTPARATGCKPPDEFKAEPRLVTPTLNQDEALSLNLRVSPEGRRPHPVTVMP